MPMGLWEGEIYPPFDPMVRINVEGKEAGG